MIGLHRAWLYVLKLHRTFFILTMLILARHFFHTYIPPHLTAAPPSPQVLSVESTLFNAAHPRFEQHDKETVDAFLDSAGTLALAEFAPHNRKNDMVEPKFDGKRVTINGEVKDALHKYYEAGFGSAHADAEFGGAQMPSCVFNALMVPFYSANIGTITFPFLTTAAGNMLRKYGSDSQLQRYLKPMLDGKFTGTMNLSETQAGSSLGDITTKAFSIPGQPGKYEIRGKKMWISGGEHELSDNIVHMVLAKVSDPAHPDRTPPGVKGISLFIVPKRRVDEDGKVGELNDINLGGLNKKMGWRGATNCVLNYGENEKCMGELLGGEGKGLATMFAMMNEARISVGLIAASLGYSGYFASLEYAKERKQGRLLENKDPTAPQVAIVQHPDVKRMLLIQKSYVEGSIALCLYASMLVDETHFPSTTRSKEAIQDDSVLLDLLTPIVKSWPSEWCLEANKWAIQIHGGYGYTRDYSVEQTYRDNRLNMIHEGTNGIQALDLLGRKARSRGFNVLLARIRQDIEKAQEVENIQLSSHAASLEQALVRLADTTKKLTDKSLAPNKGMANAHDYLNMAGHTVIAWMWLRQETCAASKLNETYASSLSEEDADFYRGKLIASQFFYNHELPKTEFQAKLLNDMDDTVLVVKESWF